ncbi:unnamed protein product [Cylicocyclus nassatus]|uniref:MADF domain-containing protein n=1 Tax=Cylicocyclus nassatus TaxID=53992 RepID=A0AA36H9F3_CYLNA|nr:unnamed protein product [Cylicocyclus nassatus]
MSFQPAFNARLIAEVKKYPCLYNHAKRGSGDTLERMRIWEKIAADVDSNCSGDFAKKRWLQLRDRYRKELKTAIKQNFVSPVRWCYFSHLSWLDPYLKDNLVLTSCESYGDIKDDYGVDFGISSVKTEPDDSDGGHSSSMMESSVIDRLLASTHQLAGSQKDESRTHSVADSGVDEELKLDCDRAQDLLFKESNDGKVEQSEAGSALSHQSQSLLKNQLMAHYQQLEQAMIKQAVNAGKSVMDWMNDEDFLYCRIIGVRLKKMEPRKRKQVRAQIMSLLEESENELEEDDDSMSSPNIDAGESSGYDHPVLDVTHNH